MNVYVKADNRRFFTRLTVAPTLIPGGNMEKNICVYVYVCVCVCFFFSFPYVCIYREKNNNT